MLFTTNVGPTAEAVAWIMLQFQQTTGPILGTSGACADLENSCERWVIDGLGLPNTYIDAKVGDSARSCGIKTGICPESGSQFALKDCLDMCIDIVECKKTNTDPEELKACVDEVTAEYKVS